ncbi:MAG: caspase family protein [Caldilineaceae bacterium]|nr:caspase family protein [Caldilineaceae bacterium]
MSKHYALLIGVDHYFEYRLPGGLYYPKLGGCVRDITKVYNFLTARLGIPPQQIYKLTASLGGAQPQEDPSQWPTYTNMVHAFNEITEVAQAGDQIYLQYSGHGGRTTTMFPAIKGEGEFDEGLVPLDLGKPDDPTARYLRDVEIYELLQRMVKKGIRLTVVFDCCHSGGATRNGGGAVKRGLAGVDLSPAPADSRVAPLHELIAHWQGAQAGVARGVQSQTDWRFATKGYTLFAACRANESAFEFPFNGLESNGALTYWLLDTLNNAGPDFTWKMVGDRVTAKVHGQFEQQTPMLQGETDFRIFGHDRLSNFYAVAVLAVEAPTRQVRLGAGAVHGVSVGTQFAIYPTATQISNPTDSIESQPRLARVTVAQVHEVDSWATISEGQAQAIEVGAQAVRLNATDIKLQRDVRVEIADAALRRQVEQAIHDYGRGFVAVAGGATDEWIVHVVNGHYVIADTTGAPVPNLRPALRTADPMALQLLVERLVHLGQYRNVLMLDMPDPAAQAKLKVALQTSNAQVGAPIRPGEEIAIKITNTQTPNPHDPNDPQWVLNVAVLMLSSDWSITQIYPATAAFEPIDPGKHLDLAFEAYLPDGQTESQDIFKIFATRGTTDFRWLELPALDQLPLSHPIKRSAIADPLEQLLAAITGEETQTRAFKLTKAPATTASWTVQTVALHVQRPT